MAEEEPEEEPLLVSVKAGIEKATLRQGRSSLIRELKRMCWIAFPMVVVSVKLYMLRAVSMMMLGHLKRACSFQRLQRYLSH